MTSSLVGSEMCIRDRQWQRSALHAMQGGRSPKMSASRCCGCGQMHVGRTTLMQRGMPSLEVG
eukprot:9603854-Prorocentrum_lima.AAC.1